jgi:hypothetical protein
MLHDEDYGGLNKCHNEINKAGFNPGIEKEMERKFKTVLK